MSKTYQHSKKYFLAINLGIICLVGISIMVNYLINIFGVFGVAQDKKIQVYHNERVSKYLFSYNYIPDNFNSLLIGPSLSDNIDVSSTPEGIDLYNASIMGANITELSPIVRNCVEKGQIKHVIICLHPYLTKDAGSKGASFDEKTYFGAFGSLNLYQTYALAVIREFNLMPTKFPNNQIAWYGTNHYNDFFRVSDIQERIKEEAEMHTNEPIKSNELAMKELGSLVTLLSDAGVNVLGYFHPVPWDIFESNRVSYLQYQNEIQKLLQGKAQIIDFNQTNYESFTKDYSNYIDHGHLSEKGQEQIMNTLIRNLSDQ